MKPMSHPASVTEKINHASAVDPLWVPFMLQLFVIILGLLFTGHAHCNAIDDNGWALDLRPPSGDISVVFLGNLFGVVDGVLAGSGSQIAGVMFGVFNTAVLALGGIVIIYTTLVSTMNTSHEGQFLGQRWSSVWIPVRAMSGVTLIMPKATGYCLLQIIVMWVVLQGVGAADKIWASALDYMDKGGAIIEPSSTTSSTSTTICALILAYGLKLRISIYALLFNLSAICLILVGGSPGWVVAGPLGIIPFLMSNLVFIFAWRLGMAAFDEDVTLGPIAWSILALSILGPTIDTAQSFDWFPLQNLNLEPFRILYLIICFCLLSHLVFRAYLGRSNDLVETRRKYRASFAITLSGLMLLIIVVSQISVVRGDRSVLYLYLLAPPASITMAIWTARLNPETFALQPITPPEKLPEPILNAAQQAQLNQLRLLMKTENAYREHGLTVALLARQMGLQEHELRRLINQTLGYRNFSSFLNSYRVDEVKVRLANPDEANIPILTIALDAGFASISPFNAAFKKIMGVTPTTYRKQALTINHSAPDTA